MESRHDHWIAVKHILRYLCGTIYHCLRYVAGNEIRLLGYTDFDWASSVGDGKSTTSGCFCLVSAMVSWMSKRQDSVALGIADAEYMATNEVSREAVWLRKLLADLFEGALDSTIICCDNQSCIKLSENLVFCARLKHIMIKYHYIRSIVQDGAVKLQYISTGEQVADADVLTKSLLKGKHEYF